MVTEGILIKHSGAPQPTGDAAQLILKHPKKFLLWLGYGREALIKHICKNRMSGRVADSPQGIGLGFSIDPLLEMKQSNLRTKGDKDLIRFQPRIPHH
jgi:hypothetical protein